MEIHTTLAALAKGDAVCSGRFGSSAPLLAPTTEAIRARLERDGLRAGETIGCSLKGRRGSCALGAVARSAGGVRQVAVVWKRFRRWALKGVFNDFAALAGDPDFEYALLDGTIVKVHRHSAGAKGGPKIRPSAGRAAG